MTTVVQSSAAAVDVHDLHVSRGGAPVLRGLSFSMARGEITGLMGPSGCGKTTLMRAIVGVQQGVQGRVQVLGQRAGSPPVRARVGYMTQAAAVYADLSVRENLRYFARILGAGGESVERVLATVQLDSYADRLVRSLSGGQRARVALASALLGDPELLVLDEPTVGLDPVLRRDLWETFAELAGGGAALIVSSHVMEEAAHCQGLLMLRDGHLLADTTPSELRSATGEQDLERAFLRLVERQAQA